MKRERSTYGTAVLIAVCSEVLFGMSFIFIRRVVDDVSVFTLLSWRSLIAVAAMTICALTGLLKISLRGKDLKPLLLLSFFQPVLYFIMETLGVQRTTAAESGVLLAIIPIITMCFSAVFLKDRPARVQILFMFVTVAGAVLIGAGSELKTSSNFLGYFFLLIAMCSESAYAITSQKLKEFTSAEKTYAMVVSGAVVFTLCALVEHTLKGTLSWYLTLPFRNMDFLGSVLYLALGCSVLAFFLANYAISVIGATKRAAFAGIASVTSILGGVFILDETFTGVQIVATVLVLGGVYGVTFGGGKKMSED